MVLLLEEVERWYFKLDDVTMTSVTGAINLLEAEGRALGRPTVDRVNRSTFHNMKELRPAGASVRTLFIFDPQRQAILLLGGDKAGNWYDRMSRSRTSVTPDGWRPVTEVSRHGAQLA